MTENERIMDGTGQSPEEPRGTQPTEGEVIPDGREVLPIDPNKPIGEESTVPTEESGVEGGESGDVETPAFRTGKATWKNKDQNVEVNITGYAGKGKDGRDYLNVDESTGGYPLDEIVWPDEEGVQELLTKYPEVLESVGCLTINPETRKLGMAPAGLATDEPKIGGILGTTTNLISSLYTPAITSSDYTQYISSNFGIVKKAHAQSYGFEGLKPILKLWIAMRNVAYTLLTLGFVFIGIGVMLRIKIDPRTVMTIQNQIPKVIVSIILITFSYAIAAVMVDLTWVTTYAGISLLTANDNPNVANCTPDKTPQKLSEKAASTLLQTPFTYFNQIFARCSTEKTFGILLPDDRDGGFHTMSRDVANNFGQTIGNVARSLIFDPDDNDASCGLTFFLNLKQCIKKGGVNLIAGVLTIVVLLVIFVILVVTLFKIWFMLLKAYLYTLFYVIIGPIYIVFGLLPSKPLGFEKWLRALFVNLAIFPLMAYLFVGARLLMDLYGKGDYATANQYVPPLIGNPVGGVNFGALLAFGAIMMGPQLQQILQEKMGVKGVGSPGLIAAGIASGASVIGGPASRAVKHLNRRDSQNNAVGSLAVAKQNAGDKILRKVEDQGKRLPFISGAAGRIQSRRNVERNLGYGESLGKKLAENRKTWPQQQEARRKQMAKRKEELKAASTREARQKLKKQWRNDDKETPQATGGGVSAPTTPGASPAGGGSVHTDAAGTVITGPVTATGPVTTAGGKTAEKAKSGFIGKKFDEYVNKYKKGESGGAEKRQNITIKIEELLKNEGKDSAEGIKDIDEPHWKHLFDKAHDEEERGGASSPT